MNTLGQALKNKLKKVGGVVNDVASDVISAPQRMYQGARARRFANEAKIIKQARDYDNAPDMDAKGNPTDAFKTRTVAQGIRTYYKNQNKQK